MSAEAQDPVDHAHEADEESLIPFFTETPFSEAIRDSYVERGYQIVKQSSCTITEVADDAIYFNEYYEYFETGEPAGVVGADTWGELPLDAFAGQETNTTAGRAFTLTILRDPTGELPPAIDFYPTPEPPTAEELAKSHVWARQILAKHPLVLPPETS